MHYLLSDVITQDQFDRVLAIVAASIAEKKSPHRAIMAYLVTQADIAEKCARLELLTEFFAYQLEAICYELLK